MASAGPFDPVRAVAARVRARYRHGELGPYLSASRRIPGWLGTAESVALARVVVSLPPGSTVLEVGSFLGRSTVVLAGAAKVHGSAIVHCIDPFDGSGDPESTPHYAAITGGSDRSLRSRFDQNIARVGVADRVHVHVGTAESVARDWNAPIDLLFLDGDQSVAGAGRAFSSLSPHLRLGGVLALHNSNDREYAPDHDGHRQIVLRELPGGPWTEPFTIGSTTFSRRLAT